MSEDFFDGEEFYNAMQVYRHSPLISQEDVVQSFENVKALIRREISTERTRRVEAERLLHDVRHLVGVAWRENKENVKVPADEWSDVQRRIVDFFFQYASPTTDETKEGG